MQKDTPRPSSSVPSTSNTVMGKGPQANVPRVSSKSDPEHPKVHRKPSMSKVILKAVEDAGTRHQVSLSTLKKALATTGYDMIRNAWRFKMVLRRLVQKGMLKQVTGKGALGSFRVGKNYAAKLKLKAKRQQLRRRSRLPQHGQRRVSPRRRAQYRLRQRRPGQHPPGQHRGQRRLPLGSRRGQKRLLKGVRRAAKCRRS